MSFSLKPNAIIAHFLPGAFFLLALAGMLLLGNTASVAYVCKLSGPMVALLGGAGFSLALIVGLIFDAVRNSIWENILDLCDKVEWDVFAHGEEKFRENLIDSYYGYYVFDVNFIITIVVAVVASLFLNVWPELGDKWGWVAAPVIVVTIALFFDAMVLRSEIAKLSRQGFEKGTKG